MNNVMLDNYANVYNFMNDNEIIFSYKGPISQEILIAVGDTIKTELPTEEIESKIIKRVFAVFIEEAQNVLKHSFDIHYNKDKTTGIGLIGIGKKNKEYFFVFSVNVMKNSEKQKLKEHLDHINSLDQDGLKKLYNKKRKNGVISERGEAGLGFIDMARKSGQPLKYKFNKINEEKSFFEILIKIPYTSGDKK